MTDSVEMSLVSNKNAHHGGNNKIEIQDVEPDTKKTELTATFGTQLGLKAIILFKDMLLLIMRNKIACTIKITALPPNTIELPGSTVFELLRQLEHIVAGTILTQETSRVEVRNPPKPRKNQRKFRLRRRLLIEIRLHNRLQFLVLVFS